MPRPFKKTIANFSGGIVTIMSPKDINAEQFQSVLNIISDKIGRAENSYKQLASTATGTNIAKNAAGANDNTMGPKISPNSGKGLIGLRTPYTIGNTPAETPSLYWVVVSRDNNSNWRILYYNQADGTSGYWYQARFLETVDELGWGTSSSIIPDIYIANSAVRLSDSSFSKSPKWFGHVKRNKFGNSLPYSTAPNYSTNNEEYNEWSTQDHYLAPPTIVKMDTCHDLLGQVKNANEIGLYVHDPMKYRGLAGNQYEEISFPLTINEATGAFKKGDKYACTYEYDNVQESELSRNSKGEIGISGFDVVETDDRDVEIATYEDSSGNDINITVIDVTVVENPHTEVGDYAYSKLLLKADHGDYGAHKVISPGDYIQINSEIMLVTHLDSDGSGFDTNKVPVYVHRGVNNTKPLKDTELEGEFVYRYPTQQRARAINLVLNKGSKTEAMFSIQNNTTIFASDSASDIITIYASKSLGSNGEKYKILMSSDSASGSPTVTITKEIAHTLDSAGNGSSIINIKFAIHNGSSVNVTKQDLMNLINNGTNAEGYISGSSDNIAVTNNYKLNLSDIFSASMIGTDRAFNNSLGEQTITLSSQTITSTLIDPRVTAVKLYWQPEGEPDWFLVDRYDINKGYTGSQFGKRNNYPQAYNRKYMESDGTHIGSDFGAWIDCPFWHYNSHNSSGLVTIPFGSSVADNVPHTVQLGTIKGTSSTASGGTQYNPWEDRASVGDLLLTAPIAAATITDTTTGENAEFGKKYGKFNQLRTNYVPIKSITTHDDGSGGSHRMQHYLSWGHSTGWAQDGVTSDTDTLKKKWDSTNYRLYVTGMDTERFNKYGWVAGNYIVIANKSGVPANTTDAEFFQSDGAYTFNYEGANQLGNSKQSPYGIFKISANTSDYLTIDHSTTPVPTGWTTDDDFRAILLPGWDMTNHFGATMFDNIRATLLDSSLTDIAVGENIGMEFMRNMPASPAGNSSAYAYNPYLAGYEMVSATPRKDAVSTFYRPYIGERLFTYQSLTGRTGATRIKPVKWKCSESVGSFVVIGNVDTEDDNDQTVREASRIMWTLPNRFDDFCILRSKEIFSIDGGVITNLVAIGNVLYVIKTNSSYALDMNNNFNVTQFFEGFGSSYTSACYAKTPKGLAIINNKGVYMLPSMEEISYPIRETLKESTLADPVLGYHTERNELFVTSNSNPEESNEALTYIYSFGTNSWRTENLIYEGDSVTTDYNVTNYFIRDRKLCIGAWNDSNTKFRVNEVYGSGRLTSGCELWTKEFVFDAPARLKSVTNLIITSSGSFDIDLYINGNVSTSHKKINISSHGTGIVKSRLYKVNVECRSLSMKISGTSDFLLEDISLEGYVSDKF